MKNVRWIRDMLWKLGVWLGGREPVLLLVLLVVAAATWGFIEIAAEVLEGDTEAFDRWMVRAMRHPENLAELIGPYWLPELGRDVTAFGSAAWLVSFTALAAGYLWLDKKRHMAMFLTGATASGILVSVVLKQLFNRPRPDVVPHLAQVASSSFPSGHSMLSAVVYLTLGSLLAAVIPRRALKIYVLSVAVLLSVLVGISRVYLGVHYPTDVLAGWMAGLAWALVCWLIAHRLQQRGEVEDDKVRDEGVTR